MVDNDFTPDALIQQFGLRLHEQTGYFADAAATVSPRLREALGDGLPLASAIGTERPVPNLLSRLCWMISP